MKKLWFLFTVLAMMSAFTACNRDNNGDAREKEEDSALERSGENAKEGMEEVEDEAGDTADEIRDEADDAN